MKKSEIIKLRLKGVSTEEIKELMNLETMAEDADEIEPNNEAMDALRAELDEVKKQLEEAQKANRSMDISGSIPPDHSDQDMVTEMVRSFM